MKTTRSYLKNNIQTKLSAFISHLLNYFALSIYIYRSCKFKSLYLQTSELSFVQNVFIVDLLNSKKIRIKQLLPFTILILFLGIFSMIRFSFFLITRTVKCEGLLYSLTLSHKYCRSNVGIENHSGISHCQYLYVSSSRLMWDD